MKKVVIATLVILVGLITLGQKDIIETAVESGNFQTLVAAVEAAGLVETLKGSGPFTIFAPTDKAFARLPESTVESLFNNPTRLKSILLYHVLAGEYPADVLVLYPSIPTMEGQTVTIDTREGINIDGARVTVKDIKASNGIIHVIDSIIMPREEPNIVQVARNSGILELFVFALEKSNLVDMLSGGGPFTVFAPSDIAFARIPEDTRKALFEEPEWLDAVLRYHIVRGEYSADELMNERSLRTIHGEVVNVNLSEEGLGIGNTLIAIKDVQASNGVIQVIDHVMLPKEWRNGLPTIVELIREDGRFKTLISLFESTMQGQTFSNGGLFTVFAPTDEAFEKLGRETVDSLLKDTERLKAVLNYHVIGDEYLASELKIAQTLFTLNGKPIKLNTDGTLTINNVQILNKDILARDGVIHVIETVLIPR